MTSPQTDRWVPVVVAVGVVITLSIVTVLADTAWQQADLLGRPSARTAIGAVLGGVGAVALLATWWTWRYRDVSPWARVAVVLVCVHVAIAVGAWILSAQLRTANLELPGRDLPLHSRLPAPLVALAASVLVFLAAWVHSRVRRLTGAPGWLRGTVVFALAFLLLLGLWLPLAVRGESQLYWQTGLIDDFHVGAALIPPAAVALAIAVVAILWPMLLHALRLPGALLLAVLLLVALAERNDSHVAALVIYANYVHVLFAAAGFALASLTAMAWTHARALRANRRDTARPAPWVQRGRVEVPAGAQHVGAWHNDGWLLGLRASLRGFTLRTERGEPLVVPDGARLVAAVPAATIGAATDEPLPVLRIGDAVIVSGYVVPPSEGPYRTSGLPVPGSDGLVVTVPRAADESIGRDVLLLLYRPCVLFLIIATLAALPGIAGRESDPYERRRSVQQVEF